MNDFYAIFLIFGQKGKNSQICQHECNKTQLWTVQYEEDVQYESGTSSVQAMMCNTNQAQVICTSEDV